MKFDNLSKKEIINYKDGLKLGHLGEAELLIDHNTGKIKALILPEKKLSINKKNNHEIPWDSVVKVGVDMVIVDLNS
ncbi:YlmC/YmxH family sporulation protein [Natranaerofaba carboxydovora]|uniref:YlmC/YmxH family sporulation protein n=1 Tax=Natranaerofaba carboxydovora TaxID=2742683 RepID=UPI001F148A8B|nr:YlmC/YmxH family sporulation protein [Natranaerofaba carboxydovora]UMZ73421.1 PRC-barrel domain protein [Natranaerofaba carboxydovora]